MEYKEAERIVNAVCKEIRETEGKDFLIGYLMSQIMWMAQGEDKDLAVMKRWIGE